MIVYVSQKNPNLVKSCVVSSIRDVFLDIVEELYFDHVRDEFDDKRLKFLEDVIVDAGHVVFDDKDDEKNIRQIWVNKSELNLNNLDCDLVFKYDLERKKYALEDRSGNSFKFGSTKGKSIKFEYNLFANMLQDYILGYVIDTEDEFMARLTIHELIF